MIKEHDYKDYKPTTELRWFETKIYERNSKKAMKILRQKYVNDKGEEKWFGVETYSGT